MIKFLSSAFKKKHEMHGFLPVIEGTSGTVEIGRINRPEAGMSSRVEVARHYQYFSSNKFLHFIFDRLAFLVK